MAYLESVAVAVGQALYGDGSDGDVTVSSGTTTLTRDMYYNNLTVSGTGKIVNNGWIIRVAGTLDISNCPADGITASGNIGGNAAGTTAGAGGTVPTAGTSQPLTFGIAGSAGGAGAVGVSSGSGTASTSAANPCVGGAAGRGGDQVGASAGTVNLRTQYANYPRWAFANIAVNWQVASGSNTILASSPYPGQGGTGGTGGGGLTSSTSGAGGGGGAGGHMLAIYARTINRGASTAAGAISAKGGRGGDGAASVIGAGAGSDGGNGAGGGGGGWMWIAYDFLTGTAATNCLDASGGDSGIGGAGTGTRAGGDCGTAGNSGQIQAFNLQAGTSTLIVGNTTVGTTGSLHSGTTAGTTRGVGGAARLSL